MLGCYEDSSYDLAQLHDICMMHVATAVCATLHQILQSCKQFGSAIPPAKAINLKKKKVIHLKWHCGTNTMTT